MSLLIDYPMEDSTTKQGETISTNSTKIEIFMLGNPNGVLESQGTVCCVTKQKNLRNRSVRKSLYLCVARFVVAKKPILEAKSECGKMRIFACSICQRPMASSLAHQRLSIYHYL